jgi:hypothetical protein
LKKGLLRKSQFFDQLLVKKDVQGSKNVRLELLLLLKTAQNISSENFIKNAQCLHKKISMRIFAQYIRPTL